tara:strand:+ start:182 stop:859 length:678 start_codon:yes stop_codon:yes gene_type:complete
MTKSPYLLVALCLLSLGCAQDDDRGESGRTRSLASVGSGAQASDLRLVVRQTIDPAGRVTHSIRVTAPAGDPPALIVLPDGQEATLLLTAGEATLATAELESSPGPGIYRFRDGEGGLLTTSASLAGDPPNFPAFESPLDQGLLLPTHDAVRWTWTGTAGLFDLELYDNEGQSVLLLHDLSGRETTLEDAPSGPAFLEIRATSGSSAQRARWESSNRIMIVVGAK